MARAFELLQGNNQNIFSNLTTEVFKDMKKRIVNMVLGTDMGKHFDELAKLKTLVDSTEFLVGSKSDDDKIFLLTIAVHLADLSNPTKRWLVSKKWAILVYEEFFTQGDTEKKLKVPVGNLNDRNSVNISKAQVGFMKFIVQPLFETCEVIMPKLRENLDNCKKN